MIYYTRRKAKKCMNEVKLFAIRKATKEFYPNEWGIYLMDVYKEGSVFADKNIKSISIDIALSKESAIRKLDKLKTVFRDIGDDRNGMQITEYAVYMLDYNFVKLRELLETGSVEKIKETVAKNPERYQQYLEGEDLVCYSKRAFKVFVETDAGTYSNEFTSYSDALDYYHQLRLEKKSENIKTEKICFMEGCV